MLVTWFMLLMSQIDTYIKVVCEISITVARAHRSIATAPPPEEAELLKKSVPIT